MKRFANNFHSWLHHSWKLLANRLTRDPKVVIHSNSCIILYGCWWPGDVKSVDTGCLYHLSGRFIIENEIRCFHFLFLFSSNDTNTTIVKYVKKFGYTSFYTSYTPSISVGQTNGWMDQTNWQRDRHKNNPSHLIGWTKWLPFTGDLFRCIFVNEKFSILNKISLKFVPKGLIDNNPALV